MSLTTTVDFEEFLPEVVPYVQHVPDNVAIHAIRNACMEFCRDSTWLRHTPTTGITVVADTASYYLDIPSFYEVVTIMHASIGTCKLLPNDEDTLSHLYGGNWRTETGGPNYYFYQEPSQITLVPTPSVAPTDTLKYSAAVAPKRSSTKIDKQIFERWAEVIGHGARARLYETPDQPYYNPDSARIYRAYFEDGIGEAKIEANRGRVRTTRFVRPPRNI